MSYECAGGSLKLKGVIDKKIKKKKKSKIDKETVEKELIMPKVAKPDLNDANSNISDKTGSQNDTLMPRKLAKTKAELAYERLQEKRNQEKVLARAEKSHKERVELYNKHLDSLSEYNDIPKVSWTK